MRALVVGAGVIGLTVGVRLAEAGHEVHVLARDLPLETTSAVAAALWYPYRAAPIDRVLAWATRSLHEFAELAVEAPGSGVTMRRGTELVRRRSSDPWWGAGVPDLRRLDHVPAPYQDGWSFTAPVIEMDPYLGWLASRLDAAGGTITRMALSHLPDGPGPVVVNCSGLGARTLTGDTTMTPVRGQVVRLRQVGLVEWALDGDGPTYVVPRSSDIVVGGSDDEGDWDPRPRADVGARILARAVALVPQLANATVLDHRVGLRPARPTVRLECEPLSTGRRVIHCYGHGGAGVTLSWGCADEVLALVAG